MTLRLAQKRVTRVRILNTGANMASKDDDFDFPRYVVLSSDDSHLDPEVQRKIMRKKLDALKVIILWEQDSEIIQQLMEISEVWRARHSGKDVW